MKLKWREWTANCVLLGMSCLTACAVDQAAWRGFHPVQQDPYIVPSGELAGEALPAPDDHGAPPKPVVTEDEETVLTPPPSPASSSSRRNRIREV